MIRAKINIPGTGYFFGSSETQSRRAYSSANPILSLRFGVGREKIYISFVQIEKSLLCEIERGDGARAVCLFARVIQQLGFWTQKIQANVDYCVWRRGECTSLGSRIEHSSLR